MRVLFVEDDEELGRRFVSRLNSAGFVIEHAADAETALCWSDPENFSALVIDLGLPGMSGLDLIKHWRKKGLETPILILSARGSWEEKVEGLNSGADDYVVKPVRSEEIIARLHALVRRASGKSHPVISVKNITLDAATKIATLDGNDLVLTQIEYRLLRLFLLRAGHILAQSTILDHLYPMSKERDANTVEVHIGRLRRKIGKDAITTVRGLGYRLER